MLVTGAAGFLGAAVVRAFVSHGAEVHAVVRPTTDCSRLSGVAQQIAVHRADLGDLGLLTPLLRGCHPDVVVHAAAGRGHPATAPERLAAWRDSVLATASLLEGLAGLELARFLHVGSSLEYEPDDRPLSEDRPLRPTTVRGAAKVAATVAVRQWASASGVPATVVRPFSVYGPGEPTGRLVPTVLRCLFTGEPFATTAATYRRDFVFVDDVAEACVLAALSPAAAGQVFNVGTGIEASTDEVVALAEAATGRSLDVRRGAFPARPSDRAHWVADVSHTAETLGWTASTGLAEGLRRTYAETFAGQAV